MTMNYFYGTQADRYSFIWIPKTLMTEKLFSGLQSWAKITYGFLMDRMQFSLKNHWVDEDGLVYVIYPLEEIRKDMGITKKQAVEYLNELEAAGLVERKSRGPGLTGIRPMTLPQTREDSGVPCSRIPAFVNQQKRELLLTIEEIRKMIDNLESGTMITVEMPIEITDTGKEPEMD